MTALFRSEKKCGCCGKKVQVTEIGSTNAFGSCDLDLRPPEMQRSAMFYGMHYCPYCGYASWELEEKIELSGELQEILSEKTDLENYIHRFERAAKIAELKGAGEDEVNWLYLCAAWCADDQNDQAKAKSLRQKILGNTALDAEKEPERLLQLVDIARRAEGKETAEKLLACLSRQKLEPLLKQIAQFQKHLLAQNDTGAYTVEDTEKPAPDPSDK
ncbi:MAG: hypothetical protein IJS14_05480 [Lentisphaeria bacterium]|nr:hypothetical protein [Lentisphaeria bacterium]